MYEKNVEKIKIAIDRNRKQNNKGCLFTKFVSVCNSIFINLNNAFCRFMSIILICWKSHRNRLTLLWTRVLKMLKIAVFHDFRLITVINLNSYVFRYLSLVSVSTDFDEIFSMYTTNISLQNVLFKFSGSKKKVVKCNIFTIIFIIIFAIFFAIPTNYSFFKIILTHGLAN